MVLDTFIAEANIVELDTTKDYLTPAEIDEYTITDHISQRLVALGWNLNATPTSVMDGWPDYDTLAVPGVYVEITDIDKQGVEMGSAGHRTLCLVHIFGKNHSQRVRLAELIRDMFARTIPIYSYTTGNEESLTPTGEYFITDSVGWRKLPSPLTASDKQQWRAQVTANLRRID